TLERELADREEEHRQAVAAQQGAAAEERDLFERCEALRQRSSGLAQQADEFQRQGQEADRDARHHEGESSAAYRNMPEPFRQRVSPTSPDDWLMTAFPSQEDLATLRHEQARLQSMASALQGTWDTLRQQLADEGKVLENLGQEREKVRGQVADAG